jgi:CheY-like chemotaxis protein
MEESRAQKRKVLVVDDDESIRESLSDVLVEEGFAVALAENGAEALRYLASHEPPGVIILDLMMPVMSGPEFREKQLADARLAAIPVIVMSAADRGKRIAAELRASDFFAKPPDMDRLLEAIGHYC